MEIQTNTVANTDNMVYTFSIYSDGGEVMPRTKVFKSGNSLAVRLPKGYMSQGQEVEVIKRGKEIIIREVPKNLADAFQLLTDLPDDFYSEDRVDTPPQDREDF